MKKLYLFFFSLITFVFLNSNVSYTQPTWQIVNLGVFENLNSVSFPDIYNGYIAGNNSKLFKTVNGGLNWTLIPSPANGNNLFVYFINASTGFVSNQGGFFKTTNGGLNWSQITMPSAYVITSVHFSSALTGWLGNTYGQVLKTTDGGNNWAILHTLPGYNSKVYFVNDYTGWAVDTYGYVRRTTNGGLNFTSLRISTDTLSGVHFISSTIGMIAGDSGRVFKTTNGGTGWTLLNTGIINKLTSIYMESPSKSYASGYNGLMLYGYGGGSSWSYENLSVNDLYKVTFPANVSAGWVVGQAGTVLKRVNPEDLACIGTGTTRIGYPFFTYYMDSRTDMLYLASEITANGGGPGPITSVGFYFDSVSTQTMNGFKIKMQNTTKTSLTGFDSTGWTTVYSGTYLPSQGTGLQLIQLNTPFMYESGKNLLVEICFNNSLYT
ncbi:MAG: YCF48-related protein, partial [Ignavibacteria bacterium]|nr:YCF48-related protein [Ignavibacteria bacterium]